ncbi:MAG TPA: SpoIID/LytB domain-containing protein, partial [Pyrinomonadaceae bacterium]|nr:SpoIID/LytB domain-containing protein [Pyrinomonadaceae bacterium]
RAHGAQAAQMSRPIFEAYANAVGHRDTEAQSESQSTDVSASPRPPNWLSSVKVHLVHDNVTRELSLEDYVLGVMRAEGTMETEPEALKALAISIRTFALKNVGRHAKDGYDFCSTTHCQRFVNANPTVREGAGTLADARVSAAVRATEGQVLLDPHGQLIDSYFGASCGGETASIAALWGTAPVQYLQSARDEFCESGPHAHWTDQISRADLLRALQADSRTDVGHRLDQIIVTKHDDSGRAEFITLEGEQQKIVRGWDFKLIVGRTLGWNILKSSRFEVSRNGWSFVFRGSGFGHGLGLCQEGAHVMAARGANYQRILEKYFPGTRVGTETGTRGHGDAASLGSINKWKSDVLISQFPASRSISVSPLPRVSASRFVRASRFITISSEHFRVTYPADIDRRDANQVLTILETARADYLRRAGNASSPPVLDIRLNESTGDFTGRTGQPWWAAAATKGNKIELQPVAILKRRGVLNTTLKHELAHVIIDLISHDRAPRWLEEGFAIYLAGEGAMYSDTRRGTLIDEELERRLEHPRSQSDMRAAYADAYLRVKEMIRNGGEASIWKKLAGS